MRSRSPIARAPIAFAEADAGGDGGLLEQPLPQDRQFDGRNQLVYHGGGMMNRMAMMNGFLGDRMLANGQPQPTTEVDAAWHRVRLLNGSNARIYKLAWSRDVQIDRLGDRGRVWR